MSVTLDSFTWPSTSTSTSAGPSASAGPLVTGPEEIVGANSGGVGANSGGVGANSGGVGANSGGVGANSVGVGPNYTFSSAIPLALIVIIIIILAYYVLFASLGNETVGENMGENMGENSGNNNILGLAMWGLFVFLLLINGMSYIFNIDIIASIKNVFAPVTDIDIGIKSSYSGKRTNTKSAQVFHVSDNKYSYEDAKAVCSAYDGRLATYNEISDAYNNGADWCGYGWSEGQMALFPTQEEKWNNLQKIEGHQHDCGRPGINGGFIDNPKVQFGINCFGNKPEITAEEAQNMQNQQIYPKTQKELLFDKKVDYWRSKIGGIMVSPFNSDNWSIL
jgi:hypothetical protein